jgi:hypothetical protein
MDVYRSCINNNNNNNNKIISVITCLGAKLESTEVNHEFSTSNETETTIKHSQTKQVRRKFT